MQDHSIVYTAHDLHGLHTCNLLQESLQTSTVRNGVCYWFGLELCSTVSLFESNYKTTLTTCSRRFMLMNYSMSRSIRLSYQTIMILNVDHGLSIEVAEKSTAKLLVHVWAKTFALSLEVINL